MSSAARSVLDSTRFGIAVARAHCTTAEEAAGAVSAADRDGIQLLIARCPAESLEAARQLETHGAKLMDTLVYFARDLARDVPVAPAQPKVEVLVPPVDPSAVKSIAKEAFRGYGGHYHADPLLDPLKSDAAYTDWAERSCGVGEGAAHAICIAGQDHPVGFCTLRRNSTSEHEIPLIAVRPEAQGKGVAQALLIAAMQWSRREGAARLLISTQITNLHSQKVWVRVGFEPSRSYYTFHKWFDD